MNYRALYALPLVVVFCGEPVSPPKLQKDFVCNGTSAREYLTAYALKLDEPARALRHALLAAGGASTCNDPIFAERVATLIKELCPAEESGPRRCP